MEMQRSFLDDHIFHYVLFVMDYDFSLMVCSFLNNGCVVREVPSSMWVAQWS